MQTVVIVVHLMIVAVLIGSVLLQKSEGGGLGMGGGAGFMSSRGTANLLSRTTAVLAVGFFLTTPLFFLASPPRPPRGVFSPPPFFCGASRAMPESRARSLAATRPRSRSRQDPPRRFPHHR